MSRKSYRKTIRELNSLDPDQPHIFSGLIWVQTVCKMVIIIREQKTPLARKELICYICFQVVGFHKQLMNVKTIDVLTTRPSHWWPWTRRSTSAVAMVACVINWRKAQWMAEERKTKKKLKLPFKLSVQLVMWRKVRINRLFAYCKGGNFNIHIWAWFGYFIC